MSVEPNCLTIADVSTQQEDRSRSESDQVAAQLKHHARQPQRQVYVAYFVFRHPRTPWYSKLLAAFALGYILSPIQLIPNFIPLIGFLDDLLILFIAVKLMRKITPADVLTECRARAESAQLQARSTSIRLAVVAVAVVISLIWLFLALGIAAPVWHLMMAR